MDENTKHEKQIEETLKWAEANTPHDHTSPKFEKIPKSISEILTPDEPDEIPLPGQYVPPVFTNKVGRPTDYTPLYNEQAKKLASLGATDLDVADFFGVCEKTLYNWKEQHAEFLQALKEGKELIDDMVEKSFLQRALGYSHKEEKVFCHEGKIITHMTVKHYPPDTGAAKSWLTNRRPKEWRDKQEIEFTSPFSLVMEEKDVQTL